MSTIVNGPNIWLNAVNGYYEENYTAIKLVKFYTDDDSSAYEFDPKDDKAFHSNYYGVYTNFYDKLVTKVEFFFKDGSISEFSRPVE